MVHPPIIRLVPTPRKFKLSDAELQEQISQGKKPGQIAKENGVTDSCVRWRIKELGRHLPAPAARRADDTVAITLSAMDAIRENIRLLYELRDSCRQRLIGTDGRIDVGPHEADLQVLVSLAGEPPTRHTLTSILQATDDAIRVESKAADPRKLLIDVLREIKSHVQVVVSLVERIHDVQELAMFQEEVLRAIDHADEATAARIRGQLAERRELRLALEPPR